MTQTTTAPPGTDPGRGGGARGAVPLTPAPSPDQAQLAPRVRGRLRGAFDGTPGRLRAAAVAGVLVCLVFAALGGNAFRARGDALDEARTSAAQLVRVQQIATDLTQADAVVTNAFLVGAKEPANAYTEFQARIDDASTQLALAARAQPGDAAALAAVNSALAQYTADVAAARANNRLFNQVGSGYLRQASNLLRVPTADQPAMLPTLAAVSAADAARVDDAFDAARLAALQLLVAGLVVLGGLLAVQVLLARRSRRIFNVPLTWGTAAVFATIVFGAFVLLSSQSAADQVKDTSYAATRALSAARIAAFDGKANESLTLVYQGSGKAFDDAYKENLATARSEVAKARDAGVSNEGAGVEQLEAWAAVHPQIRKSDDGGDWIAAVTTATTTSTQKFDAFAAATGDTLTTQAAAVERDLGSSHGLLVILGWLTLLVGLAAAVTAAVGVAQRLGEYR